MASTQVNPTRMELTKQKKKFLFLIVVKNIFLPAQKCPYTYSKDEGHKYRLLMKIFIFSCQKYPYIKRNAERHFYSPLRKTFFIFFD